MTHEELLAKLQEAYITNLRMGSDGYYHNAPEIKALRAVVELHKPNENNECSECMLTEDSSGSPIFQDYPCSTIKAIEAALQ